MTCVCKEYEVKIKMLQEQHLQLKMKFLLGYSMKILLSGLVGGINLWWGRKPWELWFKLIDIKLNTTNSNKDPFGKMLQNSAVNILDISAKYTLHILFDYYTSYERLI